MANKKLLLVISLLLVAQMALGPGVAFSAPPASGPVVHVVQAGDNLFRISLRYGTTVKAIMVANHLTSTIIHVGQRLVIPGSWMPPSRPHFFYIVRRGDTLYTIARRFGTTVAAIARLNGLVNPSLIYVGQRLKIPGRRPVPRPPQCGVWYTVRRYDTVSALALRYGTTVWAIVSANKLPNPNRIYVGQRLYIPCRRVRPWPPQCGVWYTVRRYDTVSALALRYGTTVWAIVSANKLPNPNRIYVGQRLYIPCR